MDLGVSALATLSTGEKVVGAKPHKALLSRLQRLSRHGEKPPLIPCHQ
ncbi:hypothetical protein [Thiothrix litoralis]